MFKKARKLQKIYNKAKVSKLYIQLATMIYKKYPDRETLERLKRWTSLFHRFTKVRIYSAEYKLFWRGKGNGYTTNPEESNIWDIKEAFHRTCHCGKEKRIQFVSL